MRAIFTCFYLLINFCSVAQTAKQLLISSYIKTGAYSPKQGDVFSFSANQASLAQRSSFSIGAFSERRFMLDELNLFSAAVALPTKSGNFGVQLHRFGNTAYSEMLSGLTYARKL